MAVASSYLKETPARGAGLTLGVAALVAFGVACGVALALGELEALYVSLAVVACIAILIDYRVGAVLLVLMLPVSASNLFPHNLMGITGLNPINVLLGGTLAAYVLRGRLEHPGPLVPRPVLWLYVVPIVIAGLIGAQHADEIVPVFYELGDVNYTEALGYLRDEAIKPLLIVVAALLVGAAVARSQKPERFVAAIAVAACVLALVEFAFILAADVRLGQLASPRAREFFGQIGLHANMLGRLFVTAYALLLFAWWEAKEPAAKTALFVALGIVSFGILFTFSRNAFLGFFLVNALFLLWKFNAKSVALALIGLVVAAALAPNYVYDRITFGFDSGSADAVSAGRIEGIWLPLVPEIWKSPIWGNGIGSVMWSYPMETGAMEVVGHPHNAFLEALLDMGVIGLGLLVAYYWHVWKGWRALGSNPYLTPLLRGFFQGACAAMIAFFVAGMTGGSLRPVTENAFLWIAIGMMYGLAVRRPAA